MMTQPDTSGRPSGVQWNTGEIHISCVVMLMPGKKVWCKQSGVSFFSKKNRSKCAK